MVMLSSGVIIPFHAPPALVPSPAHLPCHSEIQWYTTESDNNQMQLWRDTRNHHCHTVWYSGPSVWYSELQCVGHTVWYSELQ